MSLPTLTDLKQELNITSTTNDDELTDKLDQAVDVVEGIIGPVVATTVTETHRAVRSDALLLRRMPVTGLISVGSRSGATLTPLSLSDYELEADAGTVRVASGASFFGDFTVSYEVGRPDISAAVRGAILIIAGHLWETQRGTSPTALALQQSDVDPSFTPGRGYAIPNRAQELLVPYVRPSIA